MPPIILANAFAAAATVNWAAGWVMILLGFLTGVPVGLFFHRDEFWGGYSSFRRQIFRLGHIAFVELGILNLLFTVSPWPAQGSGQWRAASACFVLGGV